jgi:hypothetical protein
MVEMDYQGHLAQVLTAIYSTEDNFRFENYPSGFVFSRTTYSRVFDPIDVDWLVRYEANTIKEVCEKMTEYYIREKPDSYYSHWILRKPTFPGLLGDKYGNNHPYDYPIIYGPLTVGERDFAIRLMQLHLSGILFRIESVWDSGYTISIVDPEIKPSNVDIDRLNIELHNDLRVDTSQNYTDLKPLPEKDTLHVISVEHLEEANSWLKRALFSKIDEKLIQQP